LLQCGPDEPRVVPEHTIFDLLERATQDIFRELKALRAARKIRPQMAGLNKQFYNALNQTTLFEEVPDELRQRVSQVLMHVPLRPFQRDPKMKAIRAAFKETGSVLALAEQLDAFFVENDLYREIIEPTVLEQIKEEDLQLVCYEILTTRSPDL
jgi:ABC-type multidrug transport system fused ATPase/permease subunit